MNTHRLTIAAIALIVTSLLATAPAAAQDANAALGQALAAKAKGAKLDKARARSAAINGKKFNIIPADFSNIKSRDQLRSGVFLGVLENEAGPAEDVSLPVGTFNIFLVEVGGKWEAYAEQNGKIVKSATQVEEHPDTPANMEPKFSRGSGCWWLWLVITGIKVCW